MPELPVPIQRLPHAVALGTPLPAYQTADAAGMDVHAAIAEPIRLEPGIVELIPTGFALAVPPGYEAQIRPRSGLAVKHGLSMPNSPGTIDADYRGEVKVPLIVLGREAVTLEPNMRIAQLLVLPVPRVTWEAVEALPASARGAGGFGSTGAGALTCWHLTFGTYGTRMHGDERPTVDRRRNERGDDFESADPQRVRYLVDRAAGEAVFLNAEQRKRIEENAERLIADTDWRLIEIAAPVEGHHVHVVLEAPSRRHGKEIRKLLKSLLSRDLSACFGKPPVRWWAKGGSTKAVRDTRYRRNAIAYVQRQKTLRLT